MENLWGPVSAGSRPGLGQRGSARHCLVTHIAPGRGLLLRLAKVPQQGQAEENVWGSGRQVLKQETGRAPAQGHAEGNVRLGGAEGKRRK